MATKKEATDKLVVRRMIPASREEVFAAWTDPNSIALWMCPGEIARSEAQLDVRVGGRLLIVMRGKKKEQDCDHTGQYRVVEPPSKLVFTWISEATGGKETLVTLELFERGKQTELVLTHEGLPTDEAVSKHSGGWAAIVEKLAKSFRKP